MNTFIEIVKRAGMRVAALSSAVVTFWYVFTGESIESAAVQGVLAAILLLLGFFPNMIKKLK